MTRKEVYKSYKVEDGVIKSPGKFEGCADYAPYFWDFYLNGFDNPVYDDDVYYSHFEIDKEDVKQFPELNIGDHVYLTENNYGFIYCTIDSRTPREIGLE